MRLEEMLSLMGLHLGTEVPGWPPETNEDIVKPDERVPILKTAIRLVSVAKLVDFELGQVS
jgi:hypothetical protein